MFDVETKNGLMHWNNKVNKYEIEIRDAVLSGYYNSEGNMHLNGYIPYHPNISVFQYIPEGLWGLITTSKVINYWEENKKHYYETENTLYWSDVKLAEIPGVRTDMPDCKNFKELPKTSTEILALDVIPTDVYTDLCIQTESVDKNAILERLKDSYTITQLEFLLDQQMRLGVHLDNLKKHIFYGKPLPAIQMIGIEPDAEKAHKIFSEDFDKVRTLHAVLGIATEVPEAIQPLYNNLFADKEVDKINLAEEFGDIFWYCAIGLNSLGSNINTTMKKNIAKLFKRYKDGKFTEHAALNRKLEEERKILES